MSEETVRTPVWMDLASEIEFDAPNPPRVPAELIRVINDLQVVEGINYPEIARRIFGVDLTHGHARYLLTYSNAWANKAKTEADPTTINRLEFRKAAFQASQSRALASRMRGIPVFEVESFVEDFFSQPQNVLMVQMMANPGPSPVVGGIS